MNEPSPVEPVSPPAEEGAPLPPLPTRVRLSASYRQAPRGRTDVSLGIFVALLLLIVLIGGKSLSLIGDFLVAMEKHLDAQAKPSPRPLKPTATEIPFGVLDREPEKK